MTHRRAVSGDWLPGWFLPGLAAAFLLWAAQATAAEAGGGKGPSEAVFVAQVVALMVVGRGLGEVMLRLGQPAVVGQLLAGILLGPSVFGALLPHAHGLLFPGDGAQKAMLQGVAQFGVLLLLLLTGMETDVALVRRVGRPAMAVSLTGIAIPFALGVGVGLLLLPPSLVPSPDKRLVTALFLGTALSISSIKIVAMVVDEMQFMRRNLGQVIVASAIIDDTIGWLIIAVTFGLAQSGGLEWRHLAVSIGGTLAFLLASATVGRRLVSLLMRWANDHLASDLAVTTTILVIMGTMAIVTDALGVNTVLGAFVAGVLVGRSPILTKQVDGQIRGLVMAFFAPVFFGLAGLGTDLSVLASPATLALTLGLIAIASLGKFGGAFLGGSLGGLSRAESLALALGMNARGSTEVIVATIGVSIGVLNPTLFTMIVTMAVVTTTIMPPTLRWALARLPFGQEEKERLEREAFEAQGFMGTLDRLLLVRDDGPSGRLAAHLAGLLGGSRPMPVTVLPLGPSGPDASADVAAAAAAVRNKRLGAPDEEEAPEADVTARPGPERDETAQDLVTREGALGYGLLMAGLEPVTARTGSGLDTRVADVLRAFGGVRALVAARGTHREHGTAAPLSILVPTTGTAAGRRAAELAFALARAAAVEVTVLVIADETDRDGIASQAHRGAILADTAAMAKRFGVSVRTVERRAEDRATAVLQQARQAGHTLIVLGVQPRASDDRPFGAVAQGLLEGADRSLLLLVGEGPIGAVDEGRATGSAAASRSAA